MIKTAGVWEAMKLAITGLTLLVFMTIHLFQFRFGDTDKFGPYYIRPPPMLISAYGIPKLELFWTHDETVPKVGCRDIYALEYQIFNSMGYVWSIVYIFIPVWCMLTTMSKGKEFDLQEGARKAYG